MLQNYIINGDSAPANCDCAPENALFVLSPVLDMRAARALKSELQALLASRCACTIEAKSVERISTACIQVLIAFFVAAARDGVTVSLRNTSPSFTNAFDELGLSAILKNWVLEN